MSKRKISIVFTEDEWVTIVYILGVLSGYIKTAEAIEEQMRNQKSKKKKKE